MEDRWDNAVAGTLETPLDECVYGSRLIGSDPALVLHGGGNTSVKAPFTDITGSTSEALFVKGSGWDLATIEPQGFAPLALPRLRDLLALDSLSDPDMMRELMSASFDPGAPAPSVESLLHAFLPHPAVLHSHADAIVSLTNVGDPGEHIYEIFGDSVVVIPYVMPGFDLARAVAASWADQVNSGTVGMVLANHGLFTFGESTREAYTRHHELISRAECWLDDNAPLPGPPSTALPDLDTMALASLRRDISHAAGYPMLLCRHCDQTSTRFVQRPDLEGLASRGPLTPDHVIRTKRVPMVGRDVAAYTTAYEDYFRQHEHRGHTDLTMLDPAPRVVVDPELGVLTPVGQSLRPTLPLTSTNTRCPPSSASKTASTATGHLAPETSSTSSTGTWSRPSCGWLARLRSWPEWSPWSREPPQASAVRAQPNCSHGVAP